jgi:hypothetical protein
MVTFTAWPAFLAGPIVYPKITHGENTVFHRYPANWRAPDIRSRILLTIV